MFSMSIDFALRVGIILHEKYRFGNDFMHVYTSIFCQCQSRHDAG